MIKADLPQPGEEHNLPLPSGEVEPLKSIMSSLDLDTVLRQVVTAALSLTGCQESSLLLLNEAGNETYLQAEARAGVVQIKHLKAPLESPLVIKVVQTGSLVHVFKDTGSRTAQLPSPAGSLVGLPIRIGNDVIGVLEVAKREHTLSDRDRQLLITLADWSAVAVQNALRYRASQERSRGLELANSVVHVVSSTLDPEQIPRLLIKRTAKIFEAATGSLALIDEEREAVVFQLAYDSEGNELKGLRDFLMPLGEGIVGMVAQTGVAQVVNDTQNHPQWSPLADRLTGFTTRNLMAVPLVAKGEILGVIEIVNKKEGDFEETDLQVLSVIAASTAIAIQNARQYAALKKANETLEAIQVQRIASERWAVLGKAVGSLAHRINNSTTLIPAATQHLRELLAGVPIEPGLKQEVDANLDRIERNTLYTVELAAILLRRFRSKPAAAQDINQLVQRALTVVDIPSNIKVLQHLDPELPPVDTSEVIIDAFVELITNSVRAMTPAGGLLRVATFKTGNDRISFQVTDSGPGIAPENLSRVFDMFYTTSPDSLGFGLWWVKTFLEQQHAAIVVESLPNEGTTFTVTLPRRLPPLHSS